MGADGIDITGEMRADAALVGDWPSTGRLAKRIILAGEVLLNREVVKSRLSLLNR